jgi:phospholipid N-methyltransferase
MKTMVMSRKWYDNILEKRYAPEGIGAIEAKTHFIELLNFVNI